MKTPAMAVGFDMTQTAPVADHGRGTPADSFGSMIAATVPNDGGRNSTASDLSADPVQSELPDHRRGARRGASEDRSQPPDDGSGSGLGLEGNEWAMAAPTSAHTISAALTVAFAFSDAIGANGSGNADDTDGAIAGLQPSSLTTPSRALIALAENSGPVGRSTFASLSCTSIKATASVSGATAPDVTQPPAPPAVKVLQQQTHFAPVVKDFVEAPDGNSVMETNRMGSPHGAAHPFPPSSALTAPGGTAIAQPAYTAPVQASAAGAARDPALASNASHVPRGNADTVASLAAASPASTVSRRLFSSGRVLGQMAPSSAIDAAPGTSENSTPFSGSGPLPSSRGAARAAPPFSARSSDAVESLPSERLADQDGVGPATLDPVIGSTVGLGLPEGSVVGQVLSALESASRDSLPGLAGPVPASRGTEARPELAVLRMVRLQLAPVSLGLVNIVVSGSGSTVRIRIEAESAEAARALEADRPILERRLADPGIGIEELVVARLSPATDRLHGRESQADRAPAWTATGSGQQSEGQDSREGGRPRPDTEPRRAVRDAAAPSVAETAASDGMRAWSAARRSLRSL